MTFCRFLDPFNQRSIPSVNGVLGDFSRQESHYINLVHYEKPGIVGINYSLTSLDNSLVFFHFTGAGRESHLLGEFCAVLHVRKVTTYT